jgi:hypothetical protein
MTTSSKGKWSAQITEATGSLWKSSVVPEAQTRLNSCCKQPQSQGATSEAGMFQVAELLLECPGMTFLFVGLSLEFAADLVLSLFVQFNVLICILSLFPSHFVFPLIL